MPAYLDTHVAVRQAHGELVTISQAAMDTIATMELLISPMVLLELECLFEIKRETRLSAEDIERKLEFELGVQICASSFTSIARKAAREKRTRDPFDRLIVAHAKAKGFSPLISADPKIRENYPRAVW